MKNFYKAIIIATPNGEFPQESMYGNQAENHLSTWTEKDYEELGFTYAYSDNNPGFLIGYWSTQ